MGSSLEMASATGWGLKIASLAGKTSWLGRQRDDIRPGLRSSVLPALPYFLTSSSLALVVSFRHCLYAIAWLRHHKYFNASATGHETQPTNLSLGPHWRTLIGRVLVRFS